MNFHDSGQVLETDLDMAKKAKSLKELQEIQDRKRLQNKWRNRSLGPTRLCDLPNNGRRSAAVLYDLSRPYPSSPFNDMVEAYGLPPASPDPDILRCSYCGNVVEDNRATLGVKPSMKRIEDVIFHDDGTFDIEVKLIHRQSQVIACPSCCLRIPAGKTKFVSREEC